MTWKVSLKDWGTGLSRAGEEAVSREDEARLTALLARYGRPAGRCGGGMAANTAYALACLGLPVGLVGRVGADADGEFLQESLAGVDLSHVVTQGESGRAYILTDREGERTILVAPNTNDDLKERDIPWEALAAATYLHLTAFVGDGPLEVQRLIATPGPGSGPAQPGPGGIYARRGWPALEDILDHLETLLVTETEWRQLGGEPKVHPNWAPPLVLIKRGARGARLLTPLRYLDFPVELGGDWWTPWAPATSSRRATWPGVSAGCISTPACAWATGPRPSASGAPAGRATRTGTSWSARSRRCNKYE